MGYSDGSCRWRLVGCSMNQPPGFVRLQSCPQDSFLSISQQYLMDVDGSSLLAREWKTNEALLDTLPPVLARVRERFSTNQFCLSLCIPSLYPFYSLLRFITIVIPIVGNAIPTKAGHFVVNKVGGLLVVLCPFSHYFLN